MLRFGLSLSLQQRLAPQLIQSLQLLQMSTLELELEIVQQMEMNPLLEESPEEKTEEEVEEEETTVEDAIKEEEPVPEDFEEVNWDSLLADQFDQNSYNNDTHDPNPNWEEDREPQENRITTMPPLVELLNTQVIESDLRDEALDIAEFIIGNIDDRGYLACTTGEIAEAMASEEAEVERVLAVIQTFDPPGIGARDLAECLAIQLTQREEESQLALQVIRKHMEDLTKRRFSRITRGLGISNDELKGALELIEKLQPHPGHTISTSDYSGLLTLDTDVPYVTPDIIVEKAGEEWVVSLTHGNLPSLRINSQYVKLLKDGRANGTDDSGNYVSKKLNEARWLINAIHQRRTTMLKVAQYLVRAQMDWFEKGDGHLKPMVLQDVADAVEMHVSTISRVSNGKYMLTPRGVFELKYFFDSKVHSDDGQDVSARSVKERISVLIAEEDKANPLSDQEIADRLGDEGLRLARRTVAKYRDQLRINPQRYRKKAF